MSCCWQATSPTPGWWKRRRCWRSSCRHYASRLSLCSAITISNWTTGQKIRRTLVDVGVRVLDGEACEVCGIGIAGVKGFCGGFGARALAPWGETIIKQFVREAVDEALKLEAALARLRTEHRVALLHYAPIRETVDGEPLEIHAFLGSSRLEEPLSRYPVSFILHGHAHSGQLEGATTGGVPVYNVSLPLLSRAFPDQPPFRVFEVRAGSSMTTVRPARDEVHT